MKKYESFEEYYEKQLEQDQELLNKSSLTKDQIKEIYRSEWEMRKFQHSLNIKMGPQPVNYELVSCLPDKWEVIRPGRLLSSEEELQKALELLIYNTGVRNTLDLIPNELIKQYLENDLDGK